MLDSHRPYFTVASSAAFLSMFTLSSCGQQYKGQFFRAFASFWTNMDLEFSYVSMLTYFLVIDNADEKHNAHTTAPQSVWLFLSA